MVRASRLTFSRILRGDPPPLSLLNQGYISGTLTSFSKSESPATQLKDFCRRRSNKTGHRPCVETDPHNAEKILIVSFRHKMPNNNGRGGTYCRVLKCTLESVSVHLSQHYVGNTWNTKFSFHTKHVNWEVDVLL